MKLLPREIIYNCGNTRTWQGMETMWSYTRTNFRKDVVAKYPSWPKFTHITAALLWSNHKFKHAHTTYSGMSPSRAMILCSTDQPENLVNHSSRKAGRGWGGSISSSSLNVLPPFSIYKELVLPYGFQKLDIHNKTSNIKLLSSPIGIQVLLVRRLALHFHWYAHPHH